MLWTRASYYTRFHRCIVGDTPSYGFLAGKEGSPLSTLSIIETHFVRNCGGSHIPGEVPAAVLIKDIRLSVFSGNLIDAPGTFWYFRPDAVSNSDKTVIKNPAVGLYLIGKKNKITNNVCEHSSRESMIIKGNENVLMGNIVDSDVVLEGVGNIVNGLTFTKPEARLILVGEAAESTSVLGVEEGRIVRKPEMSTWTV